VAAAYLEKYGGLVLDHGYEIVAIRPGEKRPYGKDWESKKFGRKTLEAFVENGRGHFGVGIKTRYSPGVDIDCYDEDVVEHMVTFTTELLGDTLQRVGLPPKTLLAYRCSEPFPKTQSKTFVDDEGRPVKLEVLADGQQYVAFHIHPDTKEPYRWHSKRHVANVSHDDLPEITQEDALALVEEFERMAREKGWPEKKTASRMNTISGNFDFDDPFINDTQKVDLPAEEIRRRLDLVPDPEDHDHWFQVGMALYHQFDGSDEALTMWHEWSAQADNYDADVLDSRWKTFSVEGKKRLPITARYILKRAKENEEALAGEKLDEIRDEINNAKSLPMLNAVCSKIKREAFDVPQRTILTSAVQKQFEIATGAKMSITVVRDMVRYENPENTATPTWLTGYVYLQDQEKFFKMHGGVAISAKAFDATYARNMMTKKERLEGKSSPEHAPSHAALNRYEIPSVFDVRYVPNQPTIFDMNGVTYVNSFNEESLPEAPEKLTRFQREIVKRFTDHVDLLFTEERDRKLLLSFLAYIVKTNGRSNWCPIIQGAEGDGKTTIAEAVSAALGGAINCATVNGEAMAEKFTAWAEGKLFLAIEEVRLHGENRFDVLNKMKPFITNATVPIRRMQRDTYNTLNTVNYMMFTNFKNAVPVNEEDSRYFAVFSKFQTQEDLQAFKDENPDYYANLAEIKQHGDALRRFFLDYELHEEFDPDRRAPWSAAKKEMIALNRTEEDHDFSDLILKPGDPMVSATLFCPKHAADVVDGLSLPYGRALNTFLTEKGFWILGRYKINGSNRTLWSKKPETFKRPGDSDVVVANRIRDYLKQADADSI